MLHRLITSIVTVLSLAAVVRAQAPAARPSTRPAIPREWIEKDTGHRVVRLTDEDTSLSPYFTQNAFTPDGKKLVFWSPTGLYAVELATRKIELMLADPGVNVLVTGRKKPVVYYQTGPADNDAITAPPRSVWVIDLNTKQKRKIADLPQGAYVSTANADDTLLCGSITRPAPGATTLPVFPYISKYKIDIDARRAAKLPMELMTVNVDSGEIKFFNRSTEWLNHIQFSPTDPNMLMFCHEGPWDLVDRIWVTDIRGGEPKRVHDRIMVSEIFGHEFFSADGNWVWYDLQMPSRKFFWLAGKNIKTGEKLWYPLQPLEWSYHYNVSADGKLFAGDGNGNGNASGHGKWIYLFRVNPNNPATAPTTRPTERNQSDLIVPGALTVEKLVNIEKHDYRLEPNVMFSPDMKWIIFRSNMHGVGHTYAVEVAKSK
jgi:oligogalacturonide lyase